MKRTQDLLLEIGTEEIPSLWVEPALEQLESLIFEGFRSNRIGLERVQCYGTPRRLVVRVFGCSVRQSAETKEVMGPGKRIAYDNGKPTRALLGFLKRYGLGLGDAVIKETPRGEYVTARVQSPTIPTHKLLGRLVPECISRIQFPKQMRWESSGFRFARPIRWILCLWGTRLVPFTLAGVGVGRKTWGHRTLSPGPYSVRDPDHYFTVMKRAGIIVDHRERRREIEKAFRRLARSVGADTALDPHLAMIVNHLVETPQLFVGRFQKGYLDLPREVLSTSMAQNQRVFALVGKGGKPLPYFIGIVNGGLKGLAEVKRHFENILEAKLSDSKFFFDEDTRTSLASKVSELKRTTFENRLGSLFDKGERVRELALYLAREMGLEGDVQKPIRRAAELAKADLVTHMVSEFPNLQGVMGREYALKDGEPREVADAIFEHYLPRFKEDILPRTAAGKALSIADKVDTLVGFFGIGKVPTGSFDPFALRRQAQGVVSVMLEVGKPVSVRALIEYAEMLYGKRLDPKHGAHAAERVIGFLKDRLITVLNGQCDRFDIIDAVLSSLDDDLVDITRRVRELHELSSSKGFEKARTVVERTHNIIRGDRKSAGPAGAGGLEERQKPNPKVFQEPLEEQLYEIYRTKEQAIRRLIDQRDYRQATEEYGKVFYDVIHVFFDKVLVNVKEEKVRRNRIALLEAVNVLYTGRVADLSKIVVSREGRQGS